MTASTKFALKTTLYDRVSGKFLSLVSKSPVIENPILKQCPHDAAGFPISHYAECADNSECEDGSVEN